MTRFLDNHLLFSLLAGFAIYWGVGGYLPSPFVSQLVATLLLVFGGFSLAQSAVPAWHILVHKKRDPEWPGSHLSIVGKFMISFGLVFSGAFRFYVNIFDDWSNWIGSLSSNFSSVCIAIGMAFMFAGPQVDTRGFRIDGSLRFMIGVVIAFVLGCVATSVVLGKDGAQMIYAYPANRPSCPIDMPVWGSSTGKYHRSDSPYRAMIRPVICFKTEREARDAGFEPAQF